MMSTVVELGAKLDFWTDKHGAGIVETAQAITVSDIDAEKAGIASSFASLLGWDCDVKDAAHEEADVDDLHPELGPFIVTIRKQEEPGVRLIVTARGYNQALRDENASGVWQVALAKTKFSTGKMACNPVGEGAVFSEATPLKNPLEIVREGSDARLVPQDIRRWLLRGDLTAELWNDQAFNIFANISAPNLVRALASEVNGNDKIAFIGPPRLSLQVSEDQILEDLGEIGFRNLISAAKWVYEDPIVTEQRHALFAAEFSRAAQRDQTVGKNLRESGKDMLVGARLAFQLSQSELSRESIKAQSDLRKAIAEDTSKTAESTRSLSTAVAVSIATAITLIAARSTGATTPWVLSLIATVVGAYLIAIAVSGWLHLKLQKQLRAQWRDRFYKFIPKSDYIAMVDQPAASAARPYHVMAGVAILVAFGLFALAVLTFLQPGHNEAAADDLHSAVKKEVRIPHSSGTLIEDVETSIPDEAMSHRQQPETVHQERIGSEKSVFDPILDTETEISPVQSSSEDGVENYGDEF